MGAHLPKARLSIIAEADHAVHLEQPADLAMLLR
jgi:pimeloyl-ACP methyl ester carboxylesterase